MTENKSFKIQDGEQPPYDASKGLDAESCAYEDQWQKWHILKIQRSGQPLF